MVATGAQDPKRFEGEGLNFRAKLIGVDDVPEARGDKMCQQSMLKLKGNVKAAGEHKQRIVVNVSLEGLKIIDGVSMAIQYTHAVHRISFIARDISDSRAFGYIFGTGDGTHKFFAIKTEKQAEQLVLTLRDLFQAVYEMKKQEVEDAKKKQEEGTEEKTTTEGEKTTETGTEAQEGQEPVYQVPNNEVAVESPEHIYSVPQNNTPVPGEEKKAGSNLLDLEDQLENIELGMHTFDDMFSNAAPATEGAKTDPWGESAPQKPADIPRNLSTGSGLDDLAGLDDTFKAPPAFPGGLSTTTANPFGGQQFGGQQFGGQPFGQPAQPMGQPFGQPAAPFGAQAGFGAQPAMRQPFGQPAAAQGFGQPAQGFGQPAAQGFGQPAPQGFGQQAPGAFGQQAFGQPAAGGFGQQAAFPGRMPAPQGFPAFGAGFGAAPVQPAGGQPNLFPNTEPDPNILAPTVLNEPKDDLAPKEEKKDAFAGLLDGLGGTDPRKSPKAMFAEKSAPPKRSLNELKVDLQPPRSPSPGGSPSPGIIQQASDPFGPLSTDTGQLPKLTGSTEDPFDTSYVHIPKPQTLPTVSAQDADPFLTPVAQMAKLNCDKKDSSKHKRSLKKNSSKLTNGSTPGFNDDFNLPSPDEPPPPLPAEVKKSLSGVPPPPPPRPKQEVNSTVRPRPVPKPRGTPSSVSSSSPTHSNHSDDPFSPSSGTDMFSSTSSIDPFTQSSGTDPFNPNTSSPQNTDPSQKKKDPFLPSQSHFGDSWDPFSDFDSEQFQQNCFTVFDSSSPGNGSVSKQDPLYAVVNKNPPPPADDSLI